MSTTTQEVLECSACGQSTKDGLELMPSGKSFRRHKDGDEVCKGGHPKTPDPEPVSVVKKGTPGKIAECRECGTEMPALKTPGKVRKHTNPETLQECEQRDNVEAKCPVCLQPRNLLKMRFRPHKDPKANTRCIASGKTVAEAQGLKTTVRPKKEPKPKKEDNGYKDLPPLEKSRFKAKRLGEELKPNGWRYTVETGEEDQAADQATLVAHRGKGGNVEEMRISWWAGACLGGDGKITHSYHGRTIAVRNANAVRQRAARSQEEIAAEFAKVSTRKVTPRGPRTTKTPEQLRVLMPFDPTKAKDEEILKAVLGKIIKWENKTSGKTEEDVVKGKPRITQTKAGARNLSFTGLNTSRTIRVDNLVSVA